MSIRKTLARNTSFNAAGRIWEAVISLILIRYVTDHIGMEWFGVWVLVGAFTGYTALFDLGIGSAYVKYIAEHAARDDDDALSSVVCTGLAFYTFFGIVLVAVAWPCVGIATDWVAANRDWNMTLLAEWAFLFKWGLVLFAATNCVAAFSSVINGLQRMDISNYIGFGASLVKVAATVYFIEADHGVRALLYAQACAFVAFALISIVAAFRLAPGLRLGPRYIRRDAFRALFGFGIRAQISRLANLVAFETDKIVVGVFFGAGMVALYEYGLTLANKMRQIPVLLLSAIVPAASELDARDAQAQLEKLYLRSTKYVAAVSIPLAALVIGCAGILLRTWMGPGYETSAWVLRIIALGYVANVLPGGGVGIALGKGRADIPMKSGLLATGSNIAITVTLVYAVGFWGIPIATVFSMFLSWVWFVWAMRDVIAVDVRRVLGVWVWPSLAALPGLVVCVLFDTYASGVTGFAANAGLALVAGGMFGLTYLSIIRWTPFLDAFDLEFMESTLGMGRVPGFKLWAARIART